MDELAAEVLCGGLEVCECFEFCGVEVLDGALDMDGLKKFLRELFLSGDFCKAAGVFVFLRIHPFPLEVSTGCFSKEPGLRPLGVET